MYSTFKFLVITTVLCIFPINTLFSQDFCILVNSGFSYRLMTLKDTISSSYQSYFNKKKPGYNYTVEAIWYGENQGIGLRFNSFLNSVSGKNIYLSRGYKVDKNEKIRVDYYSLQYHYRSQIKSSRFWSDLSAGLGYVRYHSEGNELAEQVTIIGKTAGLNGTICVDYRIGNHISFNVSMNLFLAVLSKDLRNDYAEVLTNKENLTRIDGNAGLRISF